MEALQSGLGLQVPEAMDCLREAFASATCFFSVPKAHRKRLRSTNGLERLLGEVKRRIRSVGAFPDRASALHLISASPSKSPASGMTSATSTCPCSTQHQTLPLIDASEEYSSPSPLWTNYTRFGTCPPELGAVSVGRRQPWHFLYFFPEPQKHSSLRPSFRSRSALRGATSGKGKPGRGRH